MQPTVLHGKFHSRSGFSRLPISIHCTARGAPGDFPMPALGPNRKPCRNCSRELRSQKPHGRTGIPERGPQRGSEVRFASPRRYPPIAYIGRGGATNCAELISWPSHLLAHVRADGAAISLVARAPDAAAPCTSVFFDREQAVAQLAVGGQPDAVAVQAERPAHRGDEAHAAAAVGVAVLGGRRARVGVGNRPPAARFRATAVSTISSGQSAPCARSHSPCASSGMNSM